MAELSATWVSAPAAAPLPGYACVVSKRHVVEPYELPPEERAAFWEDALVVARALASLYEPVKMNYEIHGNVVPHLHLHLYPRYDGDPYGTGVLRARENSFTRTAQELTAIGDAVRAGAPARARGRSVFRALRAPGSTA
ncbi:MAG TPA: HIT family protein [Gaiellaceae bacterium]|nr:HIT family protein [Gaiellaceae bacterium]